MMTLIIIASGFVGAAALGAGIYMIFRGESNSSVEDRLQVLTGKSNKGGEGGAETSVLNQPLVDTRSQLEAWLTRVLNLQLFLEQAGTNVTAGKFLMVCGGLGVAGALVMLFSGLSWFLAPVGAMVACGLPFIWLVVKRKRRLAKFGKQLPEALELIARALRAGHSLGAGFSLVADEMTQPIGGEFNRAFEEQNFGVPLEEALTEMSNRVPNLDLRFFCTAVILQRQTGGDLAEILDKIGVLVRERFKIWGQIQSLTGEGRLSGIVLLALPPVLFITMYKLNPDYVMILFTDPLGHQMLAAGVVLQVLGAIVIRKIINIKV
jgi:tight adherence protein B